MSKMLTSSFKASALLWMHRDILHQILSYAMLPGAMDDFILLSHRS